MKDFPSKKEKENVYYIFTLKLRSPFQGEVLQENKINKILESSFKIALDNRSTRIMSA